MAIAAVQAGAAAASAASVAATRHPTSWRRGRAMLLGRGVRAAPARHFTHARRPPVLPWQSHTLFSSEQSRTAANESYGMRPDLYADDFFRPIDQDPWSREMQPRRYRHPVLSMQVPSSEASSPPSSPSAPAASSSSSEAPALPVAPEIPEVPVRSAVSGESAAPGLPSPPPASAAAPDGAFSKVDMAISSSVVQPGELESYGRRAELYDDMFIPIDEDHQSRANRRYRAPVMQMPGAVRRPAAETVRGFCTMSAASASGPFGAPPLPGPLGPAPALASLASSSSPDLHSAPGQESLLSFQKNFYTDHADVAAMSAVQCQELLEKHSAAIEGPEPHPRPLWKFEHAGLPQALLQKISEAGFANLTSIQAVGWPIALAGRDMVGLAQTGSGKTLAYLLPALVHVAAQRPVQMGEGPIALVLAPTRELAMQIQLEAIRYGEVMGIRETVVFGGVPRQGQAQDLRRGVELCVATPGRLLDFLESGVTNLKRVTYMVLDEADRMLDMGFEPQLRRIASQVRGNRQTLMWSATWPLEIQRLARDFLREEPVKVTIGRVAEQAANPNITQKVFVMPEIHKRQRFFEWLQEASPAGEPQPKILIFTETKRAADALGHLLKQERFAVAALHGDKDQRERDRIMNGFRNGRTSVLVATDVAQRGLDIRDISFVVNYDMPKTLEDYIHRIGRTARADAVGTAVTFFSVDRATSERVRLARGLARVMEEAGQEVPEELRRVANHPG